MTDAELDSIEVSAGVLLAAISAGDFDTAFIVASTCAHPAMLAMFVAEMCRG